MQSSPPGRPGAPAITRQNPYLAELIRHENLTQPGSLKDTEHFVFNLAGSGLTYIPGDSLGVFARNPPGLVDRILELLRMAPDSPVKSTRGGERPLRDVLRDEYILNRANRKTLGGLAERIPQGEQRNRLMEIVDNGDVTNEFLYTRDYVDLLTEFDEAEFESPGAFVSHLSPVVPRLYSIASSLAAHPDQVHLCVAVVRYETHQRKRTGFASGFLADHTELRQRNIPVYIQETRSFRLPADPARDIIMCGPGTGVAPFRAFLQQRAADGATGRNWLVFGEQHRATDFLYGAEFLDWQKRGVLSRLDLAFSRDQEEKIYVQNRLSENARELWSWLQNGAYFYVCGDAKRMARDVHQTLIGIAQREGGLTLEAATEYIGTTLMRTEKRYLRDIY